MTPDAFLQTIRENPDDDGPRLVYADWLEERGDPLGEFIRVQCELARIGDGESPNLKSLRRREDELLRAHQWEWFGKLARWLHDGSFTPCFARGFVERVKVDADILVGDHELVGELCPLLRSMTLFRASEFWEGIALCPLLSRLRKLEISDWLVYDQALVLANSRHFAELESLSVWVHNYPQSYEVGLALIDAPGLTDVKLLHLYDSTHARELPDEETRWRNRVQDELNERTIADRGEIFNVACSSDRLFCVKNDPDKGIFAGKIAGPPGSKAAILVLAVFDSEEILHTVDFHCDGKRLGYEPRNLNGFLPERAPSERVVRLMKDELAFEACSICVRPFVDPCGLAVHQFPSRIWQLINSFPEFHRGMTDQLRNGIHDLDNWLESGRFVLDWEQENELTSPDCNTYKTE